MKVIASICLFILIFNLILPWSLAQPLPEAETTMNCGPNSPDSVIFSESNAAPYYCAQTNQDCRDVFRVGRVDEQLGFAYNNVPDVPKDMTVGDFLGVSPLFITVSNGQGQPASISRFFLEVDRFSLVEIADSAGSAVFDVDPAQGASLPATLQNDINGIQIAAEFGRFVTKPVPRARIIAPPATSGSPVTNDNRMVVTYYTLIITLDKGNIVDLEWEAGCFDCDRDWCLTDFNLCTVPYTQCSNINPLSDISCNLKVYIAWKGTDKNGDYLISAQRTIRNFMLFSLSLPLAQAAKTVTKLTPAAVEPNGNSTPTPSPTPPPPVNASNYGMN